MTLNELFDERGMLKRRKSKDVKDRFQMGEVTITTQSCGCEGYSELRVALGDLNNCQLECPFCFTLEQKTSSDLLSSLCKQNLSNVKIIRFTGGEPLLLQKQIDGIIEELRKLEKLELKNLDLVIIQTNAISVEERNIEGLFEFELPILFEVSFKGTNIREYRHLTQRNQIGKDDAEYYMKKQIQGYKIILEKCNSINNISVLARLGIFHSSVTNPTFKFIYPGTKELMFNPNNWESNFEEVLQNQNRIWRDTFERKFVVEKIKTPADGTPGIGKRYRNIIEMLISKGLIEESKSKLPDMYQRSYFYKRGNEIYWRVSNILKSTP